MHNNEDIINRHITPNMWIFIKLAVLTFCTLLFKYYGGPETVLQKNDTTTANTNNENISIENLTKIDTEIVKRIIVKQPSCPKSYMLVILEEICLEIVLKKGTCTPEDVHNLSKHKIPASYYSSNNSPSSSDNQGNAVNYIVGGLLVTSLSAALIELYKAKFQHSKDDDKKSKNPLSRKCSLADLTVLKHHRKELVRRESILELPEEGGGGSQSLQGFRPPPLHRHCSFPVGSNLTLKSYPISASDSISSRRPSMTISPSSPCGEDRMTSIDHAIRRPSIIFEGRRTSIIDNNRRTSIIDNRRTSIIDSRRPSVVMDGRRTSFIVDSSCRNGVMNENRRFSITEEFMPEKRHHSRLVHRH